MPARYQLHWRHQQQRCWNEPTPGWIIKASSQDKKAHTPWMHAQHAQHPQTSKQAGGRTTPHPTQCIDTALRLLRLSTICNSICQRWAVGAGKDQHHPYAPSSACGSPHCLLVQHTQLTTSSDRCRCLGMHCAVQLAPYFTAGVLNPAAACSQLPNTAHQQDASEGAVPSLQV